MANILITGGRAPAALELARVFHAAGHVVYAAESVPGALGANSRAVRRGYLVPPPRWQGTEFIRALAHIIRKEAIDLLVPTCEEIFYVSMGRGELPCRVFAEPIDRLDRLHNKWELARLAEELGLAVPPTMHVESEADLLVALERWPSLVLKPTYSRFASRALISPVVSQALDAFRSSTSHDWVAQPFVAGEQICSYCVADSGQLTAHAAYRSEFTAGQGATIHFRPVDCPAVQAWVTRIVAATQFTGQIAFDFIASKAGLVALECNPRATSGAHLLAGVSGFDRAFVGPSEVCVTPTGAESSMVAAAMLLYALPASVRQRRLSSWLSAFTTSRDVVFRRDDIRPALLQAINLIYFIRLARRRRISALEASTYDIEWNGTAVSRSDDVSGTRA